MTKQIEKYLIFLGPVFVIFIVGIFVESSIAEMYKWVDKNGVLHLSDMPPQIDQNLRIETLPTYKTNKKKVDFQKKNSTENTDDGSDKADINLKKTSSIKPKVELYITGWCPWCKKAKTFFQSRGIEFVEYDIEKDKEAARRKEQIDSRKGVPFAVINGKHIHGYNETAYKKALSD
ncbi:MAG: glutaredoxin family protein [Deltaproteobacteria bacterium]|nr:glutaredoxin family protein [Deltaproteobacteria bacterium]